MHLASSHSLPLAHRQKRISASHCARWAMRKYRFTRALGSERARPSRFTPAMRGKNSQKYGVWRQALANGRCANHQSWRAIDRAKTKAGRKRISTAQKQRWNAYRETKKAEAEKIN